MVDFKVTVCLFPLVLRKELMHVHNYGRMLECMHLCTKGCSDIKVALQFNVTEHLYNNFFQSSRYIKLWLLFRLIEVVNLMALLQSEHTILSILCSWFHWGLWLQLCSSSTIKVISYADATNVSKLLTLQWKVNILVSSRLFTRDLLVNLWSNPFSLFLPS